MQGIAGCFLIETDVVERPKKSLCPRRLLLLTSLILPLIASLIVGCATVSQTAAQFQRLPDNKSVPSSLLHDQLLDQTNQNWSWTVVLAVSDGVIGRYQGQCMLSSRPTMASILWQS